MITTFFINNLRLYTILKMIQEGKTESLYETEFELCMCFIYNL